MTTRSGSSVSVGAALGKLLGTTTALLLDNLWRRGRGLGVRTHRHVARVDMRRGQFDADFDRGRSEFRVSFRLHRLSASAIAPAWIVTAPIAAASQIARD